MMQQKRSKTYKKLTKIKHVVKLLEETINLVLQKKLEPKTANTVGYLSNQIVRAIEISELETRVKDLEVFIEENVKNKN